MKRAGENRMFGEIASRYAEILGEKALEELRGTEERGERYVTPRADYRAARMAGRRRRAVRWAAMAAAVALMAVSAAGYRAWGRFGGQGEAKEDSSAPEQLWAAETRETDEAGADSGELMPLAFTLPSRYTVESAELDDGKSVYRLADGGSRDDVVLIMEEPSGRDGGYRDMARVVIDGGEARGLKAEGYNMLVFEHGGIRYTLTNRGDMAALAGLYRVIVKAAPHKAIAAVLP
jgi:hypothetical protein